MRDESPDAAKAQAWDWLICQMEFLNEVDRNLPIEGLSSWLHTTLDAAEAHATIPAEAIARVRGLADQLAGIATVPDELKTTLRDALQIADAVRINPSSALQSGSE